LTGINFMLTLANLREDKGVFLEIIKKTPFFCLLFEISEKLF